MSNFSQLYNPNQSMINQLLRQKDNIDNMLNQYQNIPQQAPIQNIINQTSAIDFEARVLNENEDVNNVLINRRTMFLDRNNKKLYVKEIDGRISEEYEIVIPKDEKDLKIEMLENKLKEMEVKLNEHPEFNRSNDEINQSIANDNGKLKSTTKTDGKSISEQTK